MDKKIKSPRAKSPKKVEKGQKEDEEEGRIAAFLRAAKEGTLEESDMPEELQKRDLSQMLADGWVAAPTELPALPPSRPPPLLPPRIEVPNIFNSKIEYDTSHMWGNAPENVEERFPVRNPELNAKYTLTDHVLGEGACSEVRAGVAKSDGTKVAIKLITGQTCEIVPRSNWSQIAVNLRKCASPKIVKLLDNFEDDEGVYLVEERLPTTLVSALSVADEWTTAKACKVVSQILEAIQLIHSFSLVHGDISPNNVLVCDWSDFSVKLCGFSKSVGSNSSNCGTWCSGRFKSPEVVSKKPSGQPVDIWGLGCLTYLLLTGKLPFTDRNTVKLNEDILASKWAPPAIDDADALSFLQKTLHIDPNNRITAKQALDHPWIKGGGTNSVIAEFSKTVKASNI